MISRFLLALAGLAMTMTAVQGQANTDGPIKMTPELALAIPLVMIKHDVELKYPILINVNTVLKPGMILRNIYLPPTNEASNNMTAVHQGNMEQAYSRPSGGDAGGQSQLPPNVLHELEKQRRVVWEVPINFQLALAQLPTDAIHIIYSSTGDELNIEDQRFDFFDGLFLGSPSGGVTVLAVEIGSKAEQAGIKAGDRIISVGGKALPNDLAAFPVIYTTARKEAEDSHAAGFPVVVQSAGEPTPHTATMATPDTIKSMLMEGL